MILFVLDLMLLKTILLCFKTSTLIILDTIVILYCKRNYLSFSRATVLLYLQKERSHTQKSGRRGNNVHVIGIHMALGYQQKKV